MLPKRSQWIDLSVRIRSRGPRTFGERNDPLNVSGQDAHDGVEAMVKWLILLDMGHLDPPEKERVTGGEEILTRSYPIQRLESRRIRLEVNQNRREEADFGDRAVV